MLTSLTVQQADELLRNASPFDLVSVLMGRPDKATRRLVEAEMRRRNQATLEALQESTPDPSVPPALF